MSVLLRATRVEIRKLRRTLVLRVALLTPVFMLALAAWAYLLGLHAIDRQGWAALVESDLLFWWGLFVLPPLVGLEAALLADLDHRGGHWARLFALPVPRGTLYAAKLVVGSGLLGAGGLILALGAAIEGFVIAASQPSLGLALPIPLTEVIRQVGAAYLASWLLLALELWVAVRWKGLAAPCGLALVGAVIGLVLSISPRTIALARLFPWSMAFIAGTRSDESQLIAVLGGIVGGVCLGILGGWEVSRRDVV